MESRAYGSNGVMVSAITYGAMSIAQDPGIKEGVAPSLLRALEQGVTLIDTARVYPNSETLIASTLRAWQGPRPLLSTKLAPSSRETFRFHRPLSEAYTPQSIRASVEASLETLHVERLDIVHLHQWHYLWMQERAWLDALLALREEGKLRFIAVSAQDHEHDALLEAINQRLIDGVQVIFNLFESRPMSALLPLALQRGVGVIARCVFDSGGLSGSLSREDFAARRFLAHAPYDQYRERIESLRQRFIPESAASICELALRFALSVPGVSSATIGMPDVSLVDSSIAAASRGQLTPADIQTIRRAHVWTRNFYERLL